MKKVYLSRSGAYGDHIHMSNVIKAFDEEGYHITLEYNYKGAQIHSYNPRIDKFVYFEASDPKYKDKDVEFFYNRTKKIKEENELYINFSGSLEDALIAPENKPEYFWPLKMRRAKNANICYYDQSMIWAGLTDKKYMGWTGEIFFPREEHHFIKRYLEPYADNFMILWVLRGTMWQKAIYPIAKDVCNEFIRMHPKTVIFTTGDNFCKKWEWEHPRVFHKSGKIPFRQALLMAKYVDLVVAPETGLGIGAGAFGTPKIMLLTAASLKNIVGNDKNDFSLQSDAWCSPCTRAIYNTRNCPVDSNTKLPICVNFDKKRVLQRMDEVYNLKFPRNWSEPSTSESVYM